MKISWKHCFAKTFKQNTWYRLKQWLEAHSKKLPNIRNSHFENYGGAAAVHLVDRNLILKLGS